MHIKIIQEHFLISYKVFCRYADGNAELATVHGTLSAGSVTCYCCKQTQNTTHQSTNKPVSYFELFQLLRQRDHFAAQIGVDESTVSGQHGIWNDSLPHDTHTYTSGVVLHLFNPVVNNSCHTSPMTVLRSGMGPVHLIAQGTLPWLPIFGAIPAKLASPTFTRCTVIPKRTIKS